MCCVPNHRGSQRLRKNWGLDHGQPACTVSDNTITSGQKGLALGNCWKAMGEQWNLWSLYLTVNIHWILVFTDPLGLGPFYIACKHLTCWCAAFWANTLLNQHCRVELVKQVCQCLMLKKTSGLVLDAPHYLPLYNVRISCDPEGIQFQVFSYRPSPRLRTMAFHSPSLWQVPSFISSRHSFLLCFSLPVSVLPFLCSPFPLSLFFSHFCQSRNFNNLLNIPKHSFLWFLRSNFTSFKNDFVNLNLKGNLMVLENLTPHPHCQTIPFNCL